MTSDRFWRFPELYGYQVADGSDPVERCPADRATVYRILDAYGIAQVGYHSKAGPEVIDSVYWRHGNLLCWDASEAERQRREAEGAPIICFGLVPKGGLQVAATGVQAEMPVRLFCRALFALAVARPLPLGVSKDQALATFARRNGGHVWDRLTDKTRGTLRATAILCIDLDRISAELQEKPFIDSDEADFLLDLEEGIVPVRIEADIGATAWRKVN
jgi:hypothetical protein